MGIAGANAGQYGQCGGSNGGGKFGNVHWITGSHSSSLHRNVIYVRDCAYPLKYGLR